MERVAQWVQALHWYQKVADRSYRPTVRQVIEKAKENNANLLFNFSFWYYLEKNFTENALPHWT